MQKTINKIEDLMKDLSDNYWQAVQDKDELQEDLTELIYHVKTLLQEIKTDLTDIATINLAVCSTARDALDAIETLIYKERR